MSILPGGTRCMSVQEGLAVRFPSRGDSLSIRPGGTHCLSVHVGLILLLSVHVGLISLLSSPGGTVRPSNQTGLAVRLSIIGIIIVWIKIRIRTMKSKYSVIFLLLFKNCCMHRAVQHWKVHHTGCVCVVQHSDNTQI